MRRASGFRAGRPWFAGLFLAALLLRCFVPAGFMLGASATGGTALVLCPGSEAPPPAHVMPMHHGHGHDGQHDPATHRDNSCPFAALAAPAIPPAPPLIAPPAGPLAAAIPLDSLPIGLRLGPAAAPPPPTGPPAFA